jgi:hypothetical protein
MTVGADYDQVCDGCFGRCTLKGRKWDEVVGFDEPFAKGTICFFIVKSANFANKRAFAFQHI